ncbi:hypothetical protein MNBD_ALPHA01-985 [hydrothermal vent metagenome]|uniref:Uncharacterized protein n=1 Tax=hydrothermal vent metagenome TaxID=652676 RepID=A0A3B0SU80_9ZZZZ
MMTDIILIILALSQIPVVFIFTTHYICQLSDHMARTKNPGWIADHPEFTSARTCNMVMRGFSYLLAMASLFMVIKFALITPTPRLYIALLVAPSIIWTVAIMIYSGVFHYVVIRKISDPEIRKAVLTDRRLSAFVPMWVVYLCYGALATILVIYGWAWTSGAIAPELAMARLTGLSIVIVIGTMVLLILLRRKLSELEAIVGASGRKIEVIFSLAVLYLGVLVGIYRIAGDFFNIFLFTDAGFFIVVNLFIQTAFLAYGLNPRVRAMRRNDIQRL